MQLFMQHLFVYTLLVLLVWLANLSFVAAQCREYGDQYGQRITSVANNRFIGAVHDGNFEGDWKVCAHDDASWVTIFVDCKRGQVWPVMSVGLNDGTFASFKKKELNTLIYEGDHYFSYRAEWHEASGKIHSGAYIWLDDKSESGNPWPYASEVNIWNIHQGGFPSFAEDCDNDYRVYTEPATGESFRVKRGYVNTQDNNVGGHNSYYLNRMEDYTVNGYKRVDFKINVKNVLQALRDNCKLDGRYEIIRMDIAVEGHPIGKGHFTASYFSGFGFY